MKEVMGRWIGCVVVTCIPVAGFHGLYGGGLSADINSDARAETPGGEDGWAQSPLFDYHCNVNMLRRISRLIKVFEKAAMRLSYLWCADWLPQCIVYDDEFNLF